MIVGIALLNLINFDSLFHAQYRLFRELKSSVRKLIIMWSLPSQALLRNDASSGTIAKQSGIWVQSSSLRFFRQNKEAIT